MDCNYPEALVELRAKLNISQHKLADLLNVSYPSVSRWENGHAEPTKIVKIRVRQLLQEHGIEAKQPAEQTDSKGGDTCRKKRGEQTPPLPRQTIDRLSRYGINDYLADVESLGLSKTWDVICRFVSDMPDLVPPFLESNHFSELYEIGFAKRDKDLKKKSGQYSTPDDIARLMSEWLSECDGVAVCDVACGTGKLILTYLDLIGYDRARDLISSGNLYLYDSDGVALQICRTTIAAKYGADIANAIHVVCADFLDRSVELPRNCKVISNPPYSRLDQIPDCWEPTDVLADSKEFYSAFMEKIFRQAVSVVIITPFSFISGSRFYSLRKEMCAGGNGFIVSFDNIPGNIFYGKKHGVFNTNTANSVRAAITVFRRSTVEHGFRISPLIRFKNEERSNLLRRQILEETLPDAYQVVSDQKTMFEKVGKDLNDVFDTWIYRSTYTVNDFISNEETPYRIYMPNTCRYYTAASARKLNRTGALSINVTGEEEFRFLYCFIYSSFTYWWWRIYDGGITYPLKLLQRMPLPFNLLTDDDKQFFTATAERLMNEENNYTTTKMNAGAPQENIKVPAEYRENINQRILSVLGLQLDGTIFTAVHANHFFEVE